LLDTRSSLRGSPGDPWPDGSVTETEVSVVTLAELTVGVLMANGADRPARVATLSAVESTWDALPIDAEVARQFDRIVAALRLAGRGAALDALVAATALVEQIPVVTQDRDYDAIQASGSSGSEPTTR